MWIINLYINLPNCKFYFDFMPEVVGWVEEREITQASVFLADKSEQGHGFSLIVKVYCSYFSMFYTSLCIIIWFPWKTLFSVYASYVFVVYHSSYNIV